MGKEIEHFRNNKNLSQTESINETRDVWKKYK